MLYLGRKCHAYCQMDANTHNVPVYVERKANVIKYFLKRTAEQPAR